MVGSDCGVYKNKNSAKIRNEDFGLVYISWALSHSLGSAMSTKIRVIVKSFGPPLSECFPPHSRKIALPEKKVIYTVLRSPHVHKKSREQFETRVQTHVLDIEAKRNELHHKLFWLKRHSIIGSEFEIQVFSKTRLDPKLLPLPQRKR